MRLLCITCLTLCTRLSIIQPPTDRYVAAKLQGLPVSVVLNCGIELWRNLEIDDDELLEIAIRDISYQIQLQKLREEGIEIDDMYITDTESSQYSDSRPTTKRIYSDKKTDSYIPFDNARKRFNPRVNPTGTCISTEQSRRQVCKN
jgi:hypothetical protein